MFHALGRNKKLLVTTAATTAGALVGLYYYNNNRDSSSIPPLSSALQPNQSLQCPLIEKEQLTHDTARFRFGLPTPQHELGLPTIQHSATSHIVAHDNAMVSRAYTPIISDKKGSFDLIIKHYPGGELSHMFHQLRIGDVMQFRGPVVTLPFHAIRDVSSIGMIAGGTGITPMYQLLQMALKGDDDETARTIRSKFVLMYANRSKKDILLKEELDLLMKQHPDRFVVHYVIEEEEELSRKKKKQQRNGTTTNISVGRIHQLLVQKLLPASNNPDAAILVCGPPGMMQFLCGSNSQQQQQQQQNLGGLLGTMGYTHQVFVFTDTGVKRYFPTFI